MNASEKAADVPLGMMDGAYFTSRKDVLDFFNSLLCMSLTKIEQTASGAVACQLMDYLFPGSIPMKRVNWEAKSEFQYIENYKLLQAGFTKKRVQKQIDVDRLIRARYQDNLEFCQWLKAFFEHANASMREDYDPLARRVVGKGGKKLDDIFLPRGKNKRNGVGVVGSSRASTVGGTGSSSVASRNFSSSSSVCSTRSVSSRSTVVSKRSVPSVLRENNLRHGYGGSSVGGKVQTKKTNSMASRQIEKLEQENKELRLKNSQMKRKGAQSELVLENIEKERDFYFDKLRGIEVMLQVHDEKKEQIGSSGAGTESDGAQEGSDPEALIQRIFRVLYAKIEDNIVVTDDGELLADMEEDEEDLLNDSAISMMDDNLMVDT